MLKVICYQLPKCILEYNILYRLWRDLQEIFIFHGKKKFKSTKSKGLLTSRCNKRVSHMNGKPLVFSKLICSLKKKGRGTRQKDLKN